MKNRKKRQTSRQSPPMLSLRVGESRGTPGTTPKTKKRGSSGFTRTAPLRIQIRSRYSLSSSLGFRLFLITSTSVEVKTGVESTTGLSGFFFDFLTSRFGAWPWGMSHLRIDYNAVSW